MERENTAMNQAKKLIEVAMPIKEISAESVRDKSIRHGHISTLHLWWARRPLPVCRAVVFASLVPDPLDENCPQVFNEAVSLLLGKQNNTDSYKPYDDIPFTSVIDPMEDNLRNRLLMFIGKFSERFIANEKLGKSTPANEQLARYSLIKWDNKNNEDIINVARKLIWVAHNSERYNDVQTSLREFDKYYQAIKTNENDLYTTVDRHVKSKEVLTKETNLESSIKAFLERMPKVFDPFAGGGAIPLEAARLGCQSYGNDINPVAHIIQRGSVEFPQKYGKPIVYTKKKFIDLYGEDTYLEQSKKSPLFFKENSEKVYIPNRLSFDVEFYARKLLKMTEDEIGHLYPADDKGNKPIAYYWARVAICSNPSCKAEVPLLKQFYICNKKDKQRYLSPIISGTKIDFEIKAGKCELEGWMKSRVLKCPCCSNSTSTEQIKEQSRTIGLSERLIAIIEEGISTKVYRKPTDQEICASKIDCSMVDLDLVPNEKMPAIPDLVSGRGWGINKWSQLFSTRQLLAMQTLLLKLNKIKTILKIDTEDKYEKSIITYLGILINRLATRLTSFGLWNTAAETLEHPFGRQAIPMVFDFPESNPFTNFTGGAMNQLEWITRYIETESSQFASICNNATSGDKEQFSKKTISATITDPPYYDAIAYADLSDFFYIWQKRSLGDLYPLNFATPQTPKTEECTALKHHHDFDGMKAKRHFENKLTQVFDAIEHQTKDIVSIMFAHQSTEAWTTLCNSILNSRMNITGSWAIDTERSSAGVKTDKAFLSSSVTVACKPSIKKGFGTFKEVKSAIVRTVSKKVDELYKLGFRGADLLTACFGQAVSEFGKYEKLEKADGSEVTVAELLEMARESAFTALLKGFDGDDFTKFYIGWLQLYGFAESNFDDAAKFSRVGLSINVSDLFSKHIFIKHGNKQTLGTYEQRIIASKKFGEKLEDPLIDQVHRAMFLYKGTNRSSLLKHISVCANSTDSNFWRVINSLVEVLPVGCDDGKQALGLLTNKESLIRESKMINDTAVEQATLFA
jgi:adenine-specific DNA methylase